jgi:hypothetical protein
MYFPHEYFIVQTMTIIKTAFPNDSPTWAVTPTIFSELLPIFAVAEFVIIICLTYRLSSCSTTGNSSANNNPANQRDSLADVTPSKGHANTSTAAAPSMPAVINQRPALLPTPIREGQRQDGPPAPPPIPCRRLAVQSSSPAIPPRKHDALLPLPCPHDPVSRSSRLPATHFRADLGGPRQRSDPCALIIGDSMLRSVKAFAARVGVMPLVVRSLSGATVFDLERAVRNGWVPNFDVTNYVRVRHVFVQIGTNNYKNTTPSPGAVRSFHTEYEHLMKTLKSSFPNAALHCNEIPPIPRITHPRAHRFLDELNYIVRSFDPRPLIAFDSWFVNGLIHPSLFHRDGLHLSDHGSQQFVESVRAHINEQQHTTGDNNIITETSHETNATNNTTATRQQAPTTTNPFMAEELSRTQMFPALRPGVATTSAQSAWNNRNTLFPQQARKDDG